MSGNASYQKKVWVWTDNANAPTAGAQKTGVGTNLHASWAELEAESQSMSRLISLIETTAYSTEGDRRRIGGLRDWSVSVTLYYDDTATSASSVIEMNADARREMWIKYAPYGDDQNSRRIYVGKVLAENFDLDGGTDAAEMATVTLQSSSDGRELLSSS